MNKIIILLSMCFLLTACSTTNQNCTAFENYRHNPFQFPYSEYYMKGKLIEIKAQKSRPSNNEAKVIFFGFTAYISSKWFNDQGSSSDGKVITYRLDKEKSFFVYIDHEQLMGCGTPESRDANKDFCSAFKSTQEYYDKLYMLTPDDLKKIEYIAKGNSWIVHQKGLWFKNPKQVTAIYKYQGDNFVAYRRDFKPDESGKKSLTSEIVIFHQKNTPNVIVIGSRLDDNDELFRQILTTIE